MSGPGATTRRFGAVVAVITRTLHHSPSIPPQRLSARANSRTCAECACTRGRTGYVRPCERRSGHPRDPGQRPQDARAAPQHAGRDRRHQYSHGTARSRTPRSCQAPRRRGPAPRHLPTPQPPLDIRAPHPCNPRHRSRLGDFGVRGCSPCRGTRPGNFGARGRPPYHPCHRSRPDGFGPPAHFPYQRRRPGHLGVRTHAPCHRSRLCDFDVRGLCITPDIRRAAPAHRLSAHATDPTSPPNVSLRRSANDLTQPTTSRWHRPPERCR
jgi:hypothetical protein